MRYNAVVFDWDGTLLDSMSHSYDSMCRIFMDCGIRALSREEFNTHLCPPYTKFYSERGVTLHTEEIWRRHNTYVDERRPAFFDDAFVVVARLREAKIHLGIVSGQDERRLKPRLPELGFCEKSDFVVCDADDKSLSFGEFAARHSIHPSSIVAVGDVTQDIKDARKAGMAAVGISRGCVGKEVYLQAGAHHVIDSLTELFAIVGV